MLLALLRTRLLSQAPLVTARGSVPAVRHTHSSSSSTGGSASDDELQAARKWLAELHAEAIPLQSIGELSFSRSSGPGGQNVNKVNSKATLKVPLDTLLRHVPVALHSDIRRSRYVAAKSNTFIVQADDSRKQSDNAQSCYKRLYQAIAEAAQRAVPSETSAEQARRVKLLQQFDNERRLKHKKQQSAKKTSRRSRGDD
ncbi:RF-1 domain containing protein [Pyrenophora tritici-repentis]|uniref:RF-1 domain containing protein n=1 Tax=Pyrenophora tritici-repentis TaxID=45151 RepID=A0A2W1D364_9PLEO|nr:RF-1 domain-containing protein [Pyrenophora tritici-repentis]KAF7451620.1 RF-1 domain containing protein [Pyrenophora tritici-repentis]KAF7575272.1 RF-1 domain containing protein [Pyrenophora tritici-repentis]KAG9385977.1 RF-1 domain containing protein [Pyrenophora tritici-repentis]KAI0612886.1 RF-1 domain-containing protein [Pyrenophora tritici-repentis]